MATALTNGADAEYFRATLPKIERLWACFTASLFFQVVMLGLFVIYDVMDSDSPAAVMALVAIVLALAVTSWVYLVRLVLALKKRPIVWVGLTFITSPIGIFITAFCLNSAVKEAKRMALT